MVTGARIGPIGEVAPYISWAYKEVEKACNVKFGEDFLNNTLKKGTAIFSSIPPSLALSVFKEIQPEKSVQFAAALQKGIYYNGIEPENYNAFGSIAKDFGLDSAEFVQKMREPKYQELMQKEFAKSNALGVTGFPTVFVEADGIYHKISNGYIPFLALENNFLSIRKK